MAKLNIRRADKVPAGFRTSEQIAKDWKISTTQLGFLLRRARAAGLVERKDYTIVIGMNLRKVPHYRFKE